MKLATIELTMGLYELMMYNDKRRLWQVCHQIKRGFIILFTLGRIRPKWIDYYKLDKRIDKEVKKMGYVVMEEKRIDHNCYFLSGTWYIVRLKNPILHFFADIFGLDYMPFKNKEKAIECARLKSIGKYDYTVSNKKIYG